MVETCSVTAADCPVLVFPYIERTGRGLRPAVGGLFSFPLKIHFKGRQLPAGRGFFKISFALVIRATGFWQPAGREFFLSLSTTPAKAKMTGIPENFSLFLNTDKFQKCQTDNKKSSKSFSDLLLSLAAGGRLVFSFENSFHIGMINGELLRYVFKRKRLLLEYIPQNMQSLYLSQSSIYIVFQQ